MSRRFGVEVHAYALLPDQFQLLVRSRQGRLSAAMRDIQQTWSQVVNRRHGWDGPLFRGRFKSRIINDNRHLLTLLAYIHLSPVRAGLAASASEAFWTSHPAYIGLDPGPSWLVRDALLEVSGGGRGVAALLSSIEALPRGLDEELLAGVQVGERALEQDQGGASGDSATPIERLSPDPVLNAIAGHTGTPVDQIRRSESGPRANPARRFAVWALRNTSYLSQAEVGRLLDMSLRQVQNIEQRLKRDVKEPIRSWIATWERADQAAHPDAQGT